MILPILALFVAYLLGSLPTSILVSRRLRGIDIREHGSNNAGASNVLRVIGWKAALPVLLVDMGKGTLAVLLASWIAGAGALDPGWLEVLAGAAAVTGHVWPVLAGFRGGKGVATVAGIWLAIEPLALLIAAVAFLLVVATARRIAPASIAAACSLPVALYLLQLTGGGAPSPPRLTLAVVGALAIVLSHRDNIARLIEGNEPRVG